VNPWKLFPTQKRSKKSNFKLQRLASGVNAFDNISHAFLPREKYFHLVCFGMSLMWRLNQAEISKNYKKFRNLDGSLRDNQAVNFACTYYMIPSTTCLKNYNNR